MALEGDLTIPVVNARVPKKGAAAGLVITGTLVGVYYYRKHQASSSASSATTAAAAATSADQYPPDGTTGNPDDPYSTDPATGETYGNEAAGSGGSYGAYSGDLGGDDLYPPDGTTGNPNDPYSTDPATGVTYGNEGNTTTGAATGTGGPPFTSNSAWSNWVIQQWQTNNPDAGVADLTNALGVYLAGQAVTPAQKQLIFDAIAIAGDPPISGSSGYPPAVRTTQTTGPGTAGTVTVPVLKGERVENADSALSALGLKSSFPARKPGIAYTVTSSSPAAGKKVAEGSTVKLSIQAQAKPAAPKPAAKSSTVYPGYPEIPAKG